MKWTLPWRRTIKPVITCRLYDFIAIWVKFVVQSITFRFLNRQCIHLTGDLGRATELAEQSRNQAACFHVARQHEANNDISEALKFFAQAGAYGNAVRLCKVSKSLNITFINNHCNWRCNWNHRNTNWTISCTDTLCRATRKN